MVKPSHVLRISHVKYRITPGIPWQHDGYQDTSSPHSVLLPEQNRDRSDLQRHPLSGRPGVCPPPRQNV